MHSKSAAHQLSQCAVGIFAIIAKTVMQSRFMHDISDCRLCSEIFAQTVTLENRYLTIYVAM